MNVLKPWYKDFFSSLWLKVQSQSKTEEQTRAEADFIEKVLQPAPGAALLDVPCGVGRHSVALAERGYCLTGVDLTLPFLHEARNKAADLGLTITWEHRDMRTLPWIEQFDGAFCFWGSFGYFGNKGNLRFVEAVFRALRPGARFLLDTHIAETLLPRLVQQRDWRRVGDLVVLEDRCYDPASARTTTEWTVMHNGRAFKKTTSIRLYTYRELYQLFQLVGFADLQPCGSLDGDPFEFGSPRLYLTATRP
jgi:SAM-dependent methyltransferase